MEGTTYFVFREAPLQCGTGERDREVLRGRQTRSDVFVESRHFLTLLGRAYRSAKEELNTVLRKKETNLSKLKHIVQDHTSM